MSSLSSAIRRTVSPLAKGTSRHFGYELWPLRQFPGKTWLGLKSFPIRTILDIGAFDGGWARDVLRPAFPDAVIHCYEPSPRVYPRLVATISAMDGKVRAHNFALGDVAGHSSFNVTVDGLASSSLLTPTKQSQQLYPQTLRTEAVTVEVRTLDDAAASLSPPIVEDLLIKMDVQGFEDRVIRGGRKTFARARACVMEVQIAGLYEGQPSFRDLFLAMDELGFEYAGNLDQVHDPRNGRVLYLDAVFLRHDPAGEPPG